jgi:hypothetical protein
MDPSLPKLDEILEPGKVQEVVVSDHWYLKDLKCKVET